MLDGIHAGDEGWAGGEEGGGCGDRREDKALTEDERDSAESLVTVAADEEAVEQPLDDVDETLLATEATLERRSGSIRGRQRRPSTAKHSRKKRVLIVLPLPPSRSLLNAD